MPEEEQILEKKYVAALTTCSLKEILSLFPYDPENMKFLITKISSYRGRDTANTRVIANNKDYFIVKIHEEQSKDRETRHISETVSFLSIL